MFVVFKYWFIGVERIFVYSIVDKIIGFCVFCKIFVGIVDYFIGF